MASGIRISQLQEQSVITPNDVFIINDENTNTRRITYTNLLTNILSEDLTFTGNVNFDGTVNSPTSMVETPFPTNK